VLAGRDLVNRGTWLGVTLSGRFALLTNFREARLDFEIMLKSVGVCGAAVQASEACSLIALSQAPGHAVRRLPYCMLCSTSPRDRHENSTAARRATNMQRAHVGALM